jgi:hypothetical protein
MNNDHPHSRGLLWATIAVGAFFFPGIVGIFTDSEQDNKGQQQPSIKSPASPASSPAASASASATVVTFNTDTIKGEKKGPKTRTRAVCLTAGQVAENFNDKANQTSYTLDDLANFTQLRHQLLGLYQIIS